MEAKKLPFTKQAARAGRAGPAGEQGPAAGPGKGEILYCARCALHFNKKYVPKGRCTQCGRTLQAPGAGTGPAGPPLPQVNDRNAVQAASMAEVLPAAGFSNQTAALISKEARDEAEKAATAGGCDVSPAIKQLICAECQLRDRGTFLKIKHGKSCAGKKGVNQAAGEFPPCAWAVIPPAIHRVLKISIAALARVVLNLTLHKYTKDTRELALLAKLELENIYEKTGGGE